MSDNDDGASNPWSAGALPWNQADPEVDVPPAAAPTAVGWAAPQPTPVPAPPTARHEDQRPRPRRRVLIVGLAALAAVGGGAGLGLWHRGTTTEPVAAPASVPTVLSRTPPSGWSSTLRWAAPASIGSNVAVSADRVAYLTPAKSLIVLAEDTGSPVFSSPPVDVTDAAQVVLTSASGVPVVLVLDSTHAYAWPLTATGTNAKPTPVRTPSGAVLSTSGGGVLATKSAQAWTLTPSLTFAAARTGASYTPLAANPDGSVIAGRTSGGWEVTSGTGAPRTVRAALPRGGKDDVYLAWSAGGIVVGWSPTDDDDTRAVAFYSADDGEVLAQGSLPTDVVNLGLPLAVSSDMRLASAGPLLGNLTTGTTSFVKGWSTRVVNGYAVYGSVGDARLVWSGKGAASAADAGAVVPWGVGGDGAAVVVDQAGGSTVVGALARR